MRRQLKALTEVGIIERHRQREFPGTVDFELGVPGRELLTVAKTVGLWLDESPGGPLELGTPAARNAIKVLLESWSSGMPRVFAARPLALIELSRVITRLSYPSLERRMAALRLAGLIERCTNVPSRGTPYQATRWMRRATAPILAASRWERRRAPELSSPLRRIDVESGLLLAIPLVDLPEPLWGTCRLAVELGGSGGERRIAGARVAVEAGRIASCISRLEGEAAAWVSGSATSWSDAIVVHDLEGLEIGGDCELARALLDGLHAALFRASLRA